MKVPEFLFIATVMFLESFWFTNGQLSSPGIHQTISLDGDSASRVKRAASTKFGNFFRVLGNAYSDIYGRPRRKASLGTINDLPTEILEGAQGYTPTVENPLLFNQEKQKIRSDKIITEENGK